MAAQPGFNYRYGALRYVESTVSSTATFKARNPVTLAASRTIVEATSADTAIFGIACNDAANSFPGRPGKVLIEVPEPETVYEVAVQTGVATSLLSVGQSYNIEKSGNYLRLDADSQASAMLTIVGDEFGNACDSTNSTVFVRWHPQRLGVFSYSSMSVF